MKLIASHSSLFITAVSCLAGTGLAASCIRQDSGVYRYVVETSNMPNISGVCGGLWDNLKRFPACSVSRSFCGARGNNNHLVWEFTVPNVCNGGMVESTWWEATHNQWGTIDCP
ncbi:hypothetical protein N658DRAFT_340165 [Parathielavia hyrcaniae]|uniref:Uncharacterized protein n=1 Tax=Parathielavia hyrcaniae TaxID=113614 RepID=A0AAN6Q463_9PEZI|nr:hypothetical protein N658DRAFT_340165 [Parathielavia hyrcaniae]